jgi:anti-anti-sigma factor
VKITLERHGNADVVRLVGPLNAENVGRVRMELEPVLLRAPALVVFDLLHVPDMDSSGIGTLIWALKRVRTQGGDVRVLHLRGMVRRLFELLHLERTMTVCEEFDAAIAPAA